MYVWFSIVFTPDLLFFSVSSLPSGYWLFKVVHIQLYVCMYVCMYVSTCAGWVELYVCVRVCLGLVVCILVCFMYVCMAGCMM